jgi:hypothetical protein
MSNIISLNLKYFFIRQRVEKDPIFASGPGFKKMCKLFGLYEFVTEKRHQFITVALPNTYDLKTIKKEYYQKNNKKNNKQK